jgi:hypothetical protein
MKSNSTRGNQQVSSSMGGKTSPERKSMRRVILVVPALALSSFATTAEAIKRCGDHHRYLAAARSIWRAAGQGSDWDTVVRLGPI